MNVQVKLLKQNQTGNLSAALLRASVAPSSAEVSPAAGAAALENATMYGKIYFMDLDQLTSFLAKWAEEKNTVIFEVKQDNTMRWVLEFWVLEFTGDF